MSVKVFDTKEVQDLLKAAANVGSEDGSPRAKQIVNRLLGDLVAEQSDHADFPRDRFARDPSRKSPIV